MLINDHLLLSCININISLFIISKYILNLRNNSRTYNDLHYKSLFMYLLNMIPCITLIIGSFSIIFIEIYKSQNKLYSTLEFIILLDISSKYILIENPPSYINNED